MIQAVASHGRYFVERYLLQILTLDPQRVAWRGRVWRRVEITATPAEHPARPTPPLRHVNRDRSSRNLQLQRAIAAAKA